MGGLLDAGPDGGKAGGPRTGRGDAADPAFLGFLPLREVPWGPRGVLRHRGFLPPDGAEVWPIRSRYAEELATTTGQPSGGQWLGLHEDGLFGTLQLRGENTYPWSHLGEDSPEHADGEARLAEFCAANRVRGAYAQFYTWPTPVPTRVEGGIVQAQRSATEWVPLREWGASALTDTLEQGRDWQGGPGGRG